MATPTSEILEILRGLVCENQLGVAQYHFLANEKHKELKDALSDFSGSSQSLASDSHLIAKKMLALEHYLYVELRKFFEISCRQVEKLFADRYPDSKLPLRFCIKVINGDHLATIFRYPASKIKETINNVKTDNTAFQVIADGAPYYLCNNIPMGIISKSYHNTRIRMASVADLFAKGCMFPNEEDGDQVWCSCWEDIIIHDGQGETIKRPSVDFCYKSTLVIPMSLKTEHMDKEFIRNFNVGLSGLDESKTPILGFLCLDHHYKDFFNDSDDISIGYILADILSLYLIQQLVCTEYSSVYKRARSVMRKMMPKTVTL